MARRAGKTIQQARGHGGPGDKREKPAKTFRPGKRAKAIYVFKRRTATTTKTPAYVYDLLPYPLPVRLEQIPRIIAGARRIEKKNGRVAYRFMRYGIRYEENTEPDYWFDSTNMLNDRASWLTFRADMTTGIQGIVGDPIVAVWLYAGRREVYE